jgi:hypothetical protein
VLGALRAKVAVRLLLLSTTNAQPPVPLQAPLQPLKVEPAFAVALRAMLVWEAKLAPQVLPQSIPVGAEATVPLPAPLLVTATV